MTLSPKEPRRSGASGRLRRFLPLIAAGFLTGVLFSMVQSSDKSTGDWVFLALCGTAAALLWITGIRRYSDPDR